MADLREGERFAGYRIEAVLGRGGMSVVYLAHHERLQRRVALKVLSPELAGDDRFRERFVRESQLAASLDHPNIVPIFEADEAGGVLFIAMRHVRGTDLAAVIRQEGPLEPPRALAIARQVASALDAAHAEGLVHRDVKPANILVVAGKEGASGEGEHVYLSDFGLTRRSESASGLTGSGQFVGTIDYMAPEQIEGQPVTPRTDVYSLGCVLYECLTGEKPFVKDSEVAVLYAHLQEPPPKVSTRRPGVPAALDRVIARAMAKRPEQRYDGAGEFAEAALGALPGAGGPARVTPPAGRSRRMAGLVGAGIAVLVVAVALIVVLTGRAGEQEPTQSQQANGTPSAQVSPTSSVSPTQTALPVLHDALVRISPETNEVVGSIEDIPPGGLGISRRFAVGRGGGWVVSFPDRAFFADPATGEVEPLRFGADREGSPHDAAVGLRGVWLSIGAGEGGTSTGRVGLAQIDQVTLTAVLLEYFPGQTDLRGHADVEIGADSLWAGYASQIVRFDPIRQEIIETIRMPGLVDLFAVSDEAVWALDQITDTLVHVDPETNRIVKQIRLQSSSSDLAAGTDGAWVVSAFSNTATFVDGGTNEVGQPVPVGSAPSAVAVSPEAVWVANRADGTVSRIDPGTRLVVETIPVGGSPVGIEVDQGSGAVWVLLD